MALLKHVNLSLALIMTFNFMISVGHWRAYTKGAAYTKLAIAKRTCGNKITYIISKYVLAISAITKDIASYIKLKVIYGYSK